MSDTTVFDLYQQFHQINPPRKYPQRIYFRGVDGYDVYNASAPFFCQGKELIAGRVEKRDSEQSRVMFFEKVHNEFVLIDDAPVFALQDPCITRIGSNLILSGVEVFPHPDNTAALWWRTVFYRGTDIYSFEYFTAGPNGMKDIRLCELNDGKIAVFTRPRHPLGHIGSAGGRGVIGYIEIANLSELTPEKINQAQHLEQIQEHNWLGANEVFCLSDSRLGVLCHVAMYDFNSNRHYFAATFTFDRKTLRPGRIELIAERNDYLPGPAKCPDLHDVIFPACLRFNEERAILICGVSDCEMQSLEITNPFKNI